jgi:GT2 family glycosyltransferase
MALALPRSGEPKVSFLVIARGKPEPMRRSLQAIAAAAKDVPSEVVIVLNAAEAEVVAIAREEVDGARLVESEVSLGFAGGLNLAREVAGGHFLAIVHDDAQIAADWLRVLLSRMDAEPGLGAVGGRVLDPEGKVQTTGVLLCRDGLPIPLNEEFVPGLDLGAPRYVDFVSCSSALIRAGSWDAFGGADERFFPSFYVDSDIGMAIWETGAAVAYEPAAVSLHAREHRDYPGPLRYVNLRNMERFAEKWRQQLAGHAPPEIGPGRSGCSPARVLHEVERGQERADAALAGGEPRLGSPPARRNVAERVRREQAHLAAAAEMWSGYAAELERERDRLLAERDAAVTELMRISPQYEKRPRTRLRSRLARRATISRDEGDPRDDA